MCTDNSQIKGWYLHHVLLKKLSSIPTIIYKTKLKWILYLNVKPKTLKCLQENTEENICELNLCQHFFIMTLQT